MAEPIKPLLSLEAIRRARERFRQGTAGDLFYRAALQLIAISRLPRGDLDLAESIGVLLQTWNVQFYRFRGGYREEDTINLRNLLTRYHAPLSRFRKRRLGRLTSTDEMTISDLFHNFELALGPVGAAKALHLLAPQFFPLWDAKIASLGYGIQLKVVGLNSPNYLQLMRSTFEQIEQLGGWPAFDGNPVKEIDEFNYCLYTREWTSK